jgi:hypothetical protein
MVQIVANYYSCNYILIYYTETVDFYDDELREKLINDVTLNTSISKEAITTYLTHLLFIFCQFEPK